MERYKKEKRANKGKQTENRNMIQTTWIPDEVGKNSISLHFIFKWLSSLSTWARWIGRKVAIFSNGTENSHLEIRCLFYFSQVSNSSDGSSEVTVDIHSFTFWLVNNLFYPCDTSLWHHKKTLHCTQKIQ